jgi:hypothetical protein
MEGTISTRRSCRSQSNRPQKRPDSKR